MHFFANINVLLFAYLIRLGAIAAATTPLCSDTIEIAGGGTLNNEDLAPISMDAIKELQLAVFLENLQVSLFNTDLTNLRGWKTSGYNNNTTQTLSKIAAQQQVHLASLTNLLDNNRTELIPICNYTFPMNSTPEEFVDLAHLVTSISIGATIGITERLASAGPMLIRSASSILTVEARHDAVFRLITGKEPSPTPFDTGISDTWAYNLALSFVVPGSCFVEIPLPILPKLTATQSATAPEVNTTKSLTQFEFTWDHTQASFVAESNKQLMIGWINQLNVPVYTPLDITVAGKGTASVPQGMNGVAFAVVTVQQPDSIGDLTLATMAGPLAVLLS